MVANVCSAASSVGATTGCLAADEAGAAFPTTAIIPTGTLSPVGYKRNHAIRLPTRHQPSTVSLTGCFARTTHDSSQRVGVGTSTISYESCGKGDDEAGFEQVRKVPIAVRY